MSLLSDDFYTYDEFEAKRKQTDKWLEFIDGTIFMAPSPNIRHQEIASFLHGELYQVFKGMKCKVFSAPTDVLFEEKNGQKNRVMPDLFVTCKTDQFTENELLGPPEFIIEILSPSNKSHVMVTKLNLYMNHGVQEYWIVDPMEKRVFVYFQEEKADIHFDLVEINGLLKSQLFSNVEIDTNELFS